MTQAKNMTMMTFMNTENLESNNIPQPDPSWDYYPTWHLLIHYKTKIDKVLKLIETSEDREIKTDHYIRHELFSVSVSLDALIRSLDTTESDYQ